MSAAGLPCASTWQSALRATTLRDKFTTEHDESSNMKSAVLWTGGKDSALALHRSAGLGVTELVTFVPPDAHFQAHDLELMAWQARALGLPHRRVVVGLPYQEGYER